MPNETHLEEFTDQQLSEEIGSLVADLDALEPSSSEREPLVVRLTAIIEEQNRRRDIAIRRAIANAPSVVADPPGPTPREVRLQSTEEAGEPDETATPRPRTLRAVAKEESYWGSWWSGLGEGLVDGVVALGDALTWSHLPSLHSESERRLKFYGSDAKYIRASARFTGGVIHAIVLAPASAADKALKAKDVFIVTSELLISEGLQQGAEHVGEEHVRPAVREALAPLRAPVQPIGAGPVDPSLLLVLRDWMIQNGIPPEVAAQEIENLTVETFKRIVRDVGNDSVADLFDALEAADRPFDPQHHIFPQAHREHFESAFEEYVESGSIDDYTIELTPDEHKAVHAGDRKGGWWNAEWRQFFEENPEPTAADIFSHATEMLRHHNLLDRPVRPYGWR